MAARDTFTDPRSGSRVAFERTAADTAGRLLVTRSLLTAAFPSPPLHVHPRQLERLAVLEGRLLVVAGGRGHVLGAGEQIEVAAGTPHTFAVAGREPVDVRIDFEPAGEMAGFLEAIARLAEAGRVGRRGRPRLLDLAPVALAHRDDVRLARVPAALQDVLLTALARTRWLRWTGEPPRPRLAAGLAGVRALAGPRWGPRARAVERASA
jgi:mannose-6-phosphate isomerase-like protein (cupin superfamily)